MADADRNLSIVFIAAAEKAAEQNKRGATYYTRENVAAEFCEELEPLMKGIGALAAQDGGSFQYQDNADGGDPSRFPVNGTVTMSTGAEAHSFTLQATSIVRGGLYISIGYKEVEGAVPSYQEDRGRKDFAEAREALAQWFAKHAPDRIADLKELLLPQEPEPVVGIDKTMRVDGPLRLRKTQQNP